jgi:hypothetical protein
MLHWLFVVAAAVQVLLPATASVADGWLQREEVGAGRPGAHVEAYGSTSCARMHADDCALCRVLSLRGATAPTPEAPVPADRVIAVSLASSERTLCSSRAPGDPPQRAPPI